LEPTNQGSGRCVIRELGVRKQVENISHLDLGVDVEKNTEKADRILQTIGSYLFCVCYQPREDQHSMAYDGLALN
jgi:hypothetical protein